ncbi:MAG: TlpA family protein disulfide reductase [Flavobacteriaceae bacterium]
MIKPFDFISKNSLLSSSNRDFLLYTFLKSIKIDYPGSKFKSRLAKFKSITSNASYLYELENEKGKRKLKLAEKKTNEVRLIDEQNNETTLKKILEDNKGKIVYIDFWASWCAPCRKAFLSYPKLKETYKDKDVVFLFISIDRDIAKWEKANMEENLSNSYYTLNYPIAEFYEKLKISRIPRYLIFDKSGKLVNERVFGPDSDLIKGVIDELLMK